MGVLRVGSLLFEIPELRDVVLQDQRKLGRQRGARQRLGADEEERGQWESGTEGTTSCHPRRDG